MRSQRRFGSSLRGFPRPGEFALLGIILTGGLYPLAKAAFPTHVPVICGLPTPDRATATHLAVEGKLAAAALVALCLPLGARMFAGSWLALLHASPLRIGLAVASVVTTMLTAYDACTGFHAVERGAHGCECWLTALLAGLAALTFAVCVLAGRAIVRLLKQTLRAIAGAVFQRRCLLPQIFARRVRFAVANAAGVLLACSRAGRGPPARLAASAAG